MTAGLHSTLLQVAVIGALAVMSPGPDFLIVTRNSLRFSKRVGIATAVGIVCGNVWWVSASIAGVSYLISTTPLLFAVLKWCGAAYLVFLGAASLFSKKPQSPMGSAGEPVRETEGELSAGAGFRMGLLTNALNPKCALFYISFFSVIITPDTPRVFQWLYGGVVMMIALAWFSLLATVLSFRKVKDKFERSAVWIERITGVILIALGVKVALG